MTEHTGASYQDIAAKYASKIDTKPIHLHYERPAVLSLLPELTNAKVLDVGCGSGWYAEHLANAGANVTAFDLNPEFVALTQARLGERATVLQADLAQPLDFAPPDTFDVVLCPLVMHYLKDWHPALREFHRVLQRHGILVFSNHHPFMDWQLFQTDDYFATEIIDDEWEDIGKVQFYRRPLTAIGQALDAAGFWIDRLLEPQPTEALRQADPKLYQRLAKNPWFLVIRARKVQAGWR